MFWWFDIREPQVVIIVKDHVWFTQCNPSWGSCEAALDLTTKDDMEVSQNRATLEIISGIVPCKSATSGYPHDHGTPPI